MGPLLGALLFPETRGVVDRIAIFVDAGYLLAEGGRLTCGTTSRTGFVCDYAALLDRLQLEIAQHSRRLDLLRIYWYD
jgi:hypothetical protein